MKQTLKERYEWLKANHICVSCGKNPIKIGQSLIRCSACLEANRKRPVNKDYIGVSLQKRDQRRRLKLEVFNAYGGPVCDCCGEKEFMFLELDHKNNDGADHRFTLHGREVYRWAKSNGFPPIFRVLCSNCNSGRQRAGGVCPHELRLLQARINPVSDMGTASLAFRDDCERSVAIRFSHDKGPSYGYLFADEIWKTREK